MSRPLDRFFHPNAARSRRSTRQPLASSPRRLRVLLIGVAVVFSLLAGRAVQVQAIDAQAVAAEAADQITVARDIPAFRGEITDRNGQPLAYTEGTVTVVADPEMIRTNGKFDEPMTSRDTEIAGTAAQRVADLIAAHVGGQAADYLPKLTRAGSRYAIVARNVSAADFARLVADMKSQTLIGVYSESAPTRRYINGTLAANILGWVNQQGKGAGGLEYLLDSTLSGTPGREEYETSANGRIPLGTSVLVPARNGDGYRLTIDAGLQWQVEQILAQRVRISKGDSGVAIVMNAKTGEILALANYPTFDPNDYGSYDLESLGNRAFTDSYTPGSVQKVLTFAALLDAGLVRPTDLVELPQQVMSGDHPVRDPFTHEADPEVMYARGIIARSSNVGAILMGRKIDSNRLREYLLSFGLGKKTGLWLSGETAGALPPQDMPGYSADGIAFGGSALAVTAVQEITAVAAVTNGGIYHPATLIAGRTGADGVEQPVEGGEARRVISATASADLRSMMEGMVQYNESRGSRTFTIDGYRTGAKTGTSKKYDFDCACFNGLVTSTIGVGPIEDPQIVTYVVVDNPQRGAAGAAVAGPGYHDIMTVALNRYGVKPSTGKAPKLPVYP
ncbi:MAG TPA: penicillin-binding protein 2 [Propionicimonas sp.]|nr:penicillin-binding protein 2 [Propionicimonas sp.]